MGSSQHERNWDSQVVALCYKIKEAVDKKGVGKANWEQCFVLHSLADYVGQYVESWITISGERKMSNSAAKAAKELLIVLKRGLQLINLCHQKVSPATIFIILSCKGEMSETIDDARAYIHMINNLQESSNDVEKIKSQIDSACKNLQSSLEKASKRDKAALLLSLRSQSGTLESRMLQILEKGLDANIFDQDLSSQKKLGSGSFGMVSSAMWHDRPVAVKTFTADGYFKDELDVFGQMVGADYYCPHIVQILGYTGEQKLVLELMDLDLKTHITGLKDPLPLIQSLDIILQIAKAMRYLHDIRVVHRDLKPANVLVKVRDNGSLLIKLTDFGISKENFETAKSNTDMRGTFLYMAPEILEDKESYSRKVDVYSFGLICAEILMGKIRKRRGEILKLPKDVPKLLENLIQSCMKQNDEDRPDFKIICDKLWLVKDEVLANVIEGEAIELINETWMESASPADHASNNNVNAQSEVSDFVPPIKAPSFKKAIYSFYHEDISHGIYSVRDLPQGILVNMRLDGLLDVKSSGQVEIWRSLENHSSQDVDILEQFKELLDYQSMTLNLYLHIGGFEQSKYFSVALSSPKSRTTFVNSIVDLVKRYPMLNGLVIDWQYVSDNGENYGMPGNFTDKSDVNNLLLTLQELRKVLLVDQFVIALTCTPDLDKQWPIEKAIHLVDQIYLLLCKANCYFTNHQSSLYRSSHGQYSIDEGVKMYISRGVPSSKIFIGATLLALGFDGTDGLGMPASGFTPISCVPYNELLMVELEEKWDDEAKVPYAHDLIHKVVYSYDNVQSIIEKAKYVMENDLGGIVVSDSLWDFPCDHERSVMRALHDHLPHC